MEATFSGISSAEGEADGVPSSDGSNSHHTKLPHLIEGFLSRRTRNALLRLEGKEIHYEPQLRRKTRKTWRKVSGFSVRWFSTL